MRLRFTLTVPLLAGILVVIEETLRRFSAGSSVVSSILSSTTSVVGWEFVVALLFVACRLFVLWLLPPLLLVWLLSRIGRPNRRTKPPTS